MRADRLLAITMLLQTRGKMTAEALAEALEVSRRTILRDIDALSLAGIPIYAEGGHGGGIALDENYRLSLTGLKEDEVHSLFISSNNQLLKDVGLGEAAENTLLKLFAALPSLHRPSVDHIRQRIHIDPVWWWQDTEPLPFWAELQQAVYEDRHIQAVYQNFNGEVSERILEPYSLVAKASNWYLIAKRDGELRTYRVSRLQQVTLLDAHFRRPDDFDLATYWKEHAGDFVAAISEYGFTLQIEPQHMNFVKWLMTGRYEIVESVDSSGWLTVRFWVESVDLARMLVFGLGAKAVKIIEPRDLQESILADARQIIETFRS